LLSVPARLVPSLLSIYFDDLKPVACQALITSKTISAEAKKGKKKGLSLLLVHFFLKSSLTPFASAF
jgi:hypothetical protein